MSAHPLSVIITEGSGAARVVSWLLYHPSTFFPQIQSLRKTSLFTGFKTTNLNGRDEGA